jgi:superfamily II DNA/RNA helicase
MGELLYDGINAMSLCAAKSNADRQKVIQATRVGKVWLLITTDVASRGLDLPMTSTVINYDCPNSVTDYVHRVGRRGFTTLLAFSKIEKIYFLNSLKRCGRYNRSGHAITFFSDADR